MSVIFKNEPNYDLIIEGVKRFLVQAEKDKKEAKANEKKPAA